ncbi:LamG-like jellyroll fold domain-containing protein [Haloferula sp.]|uniref:LamG-like jellyroll fold domain-containing protein n=1 Tax=Haloferula sp. TaxID=2497595 RepID=UPI00329B494C
MKKEAFEMAISRYLDDEISPEEFHELEEFLESSKEAREHYLEFVDLHNAMDLEVSLPHLIHPGASNVVPMDRILKRQKRRSFIQSALAAAATIALLGVLFKLVNVPEPEALLSFRVTTDSAFSVTHSTVFEEGEAPEPGTLAKGSRLKLTQGVVELTLSTGVVSVVQAPADLTVLEEDLLSVKEGVAWFKVPENAVGFQVSTPRLLVTDLGTEFGVICAPETLDQVHLLKGEVEVRNRHGLGNSELLTGSGARIAGPAGRLKSTTVRPNVFLDVLPPCLPHIHLSFDSIEDGKLSVGGTHADAPDITAEMVPSAEAAISDRLVSGINGQALHLGGQGDFVRTNWSGFSGSRARTVSCWVRVAEGAEFNPNLALFGWGSHKNEGKWKMHFVGDEAGRGRYARISLFGNVWATALSPRLDDDQWHHLVVVSYGGTSENGRPDLAIFVDGQRRTLTHHNGRNSQAKSGEVNTVVTHGSADPFLVGKSVISQEQSFLGSIDELIIYDGALSNESIKELATGNLPTRSQH